MQQFDITEIVRLIICIIVLIFTLYIAPYIRSRIKEDKLKEIVKWVDIAVSAAEMIYAGSGRGAEKKEYVVNFLAEKGFSIDTDSLDNMIESAVYKMKHALLGDAS